MQGRSKALDCKHFQLCQSERYCNPKAQSPKILFLDTYFHGGKSSTLNNYCQKAMLYHHTVHSMLQLTLKKQLIGVCLFSISKRTRVASASAMMKRKVLFHLQSEDNQDAGKSKAKKRKEDVKISDEVCSWKTICIK